MRLQVYAEEMRAEEQTAFLSQNNQIECCSSQTNSTERMPFSEEVGMDQMGTLGQSKDLRSLQAAFCVPITEMTSLIIASHSKCFYQTNIE